MKKVNWEDFVGKKFNSLTILKITHIPDKHGDIKPYAVCKCDCGNETIVPNGILIAGRTISCGCMTALNPKDPRSDDPEISRQYGRASMILERCRNPWSNSFKNYGGRGIKNELGDTPWDVAESLSKVPGYFEGAQIDRINNDGNYSLNNIRWVTSQENTQNSSIIIPLSKEQLSSRLLSLISAKKHMKRISGDYGDFNVFKVSGLPCYEDVDLYLCVHKDLSSSDYIKKLKKNYDDCGYEIDDAFINKIKINK